MTQDDQGALQMDYPSMPPDCYYLGYLEEIPLSMVTMDTCYQGLEGILKFDDLAYEIRHISDSQHLNTLFLREWQTPMQWDLLITWDIRRVGTPCSLKKISVQPPGSLVSCSHPITEFCSQFQNNIQCVQPRVKMCPIPNKAS